VTKAAGSVSRHLLFVIVCVCSIALGGAYIAFRHVPGTNGDVGTADVPLAENMAVLEGKPGLLFSSAAFDKTNGYLELLATGAPDGTRYRTPLRCERVHFASGSGICLAAERGAVTRYSAHVFGADFRVRATLPLQGIPSRTRVSPDGKRGVITVFVNGDSYNSTSFSTRTTLVDMETGRAIADLEEFLVTRDGMPFKSIDFNFWGVTFATGDRFFATVGTRGTTYLLEGNVDARSARVRFEGVECPSLSPDGTKIVFKKRVASSKWRLHILDLATLREMPLGETRSVDDQVEWLDDDSIAYALPSNAGGMGGSDVWTLAIDGNTPPRLLTDRAYSPVAIR
jgi:hypothetical protein